MESGNENVSGEAPVTVESLEPSATPPPDPVDEVEQRFEDAKAASAEGRLEEALSLSPRRAFTR